jgi:polar amino acid transport system permease protein
LATKNDLRLQALPRPVRLLLILVAITAVVSVLFALQYYLGGPIRLSVVSEIYDLALDADNATAAVGTKDGKVHVWTFPRQLNTGISADYDVSQEAPWPRRTFTGHDAAVIEVAFVPDGSSLISVSQDGQVRLWNIASGQMDRELSTGDGFLVDADVSADGTSLAVLREDGNVQVWDLTTGQEIQSIAPGQEARLVVALNADGTLVAAGEGTGIKIWDTQTGSQVHDLPGYWEDPEEQDTWLGFEKEVTALAFSGDGLTLASGSADTTIIFWDLETGEIAADSEGHWATVTTMVFDQDSKSLLSGGKDNKIRILRLPGGKSIAIYEGHLATIHGVAFGLQPDTIFTTGADGTLRVWETANQKVIHIEWSSFGFQPAWGRLLALWLLISGLLSLFCLWGLWRLRIWSHLFAVGLYLLGPIIVLGLPLFEVLTYPLTWGLKLQIGWPLVALAIWYIVLLWALLREPVALFYEAPHAAPLAEQLQVSQRTVKTRFGIFSLAVWIGLLTVLYSVLRRFNLDIAFMGHYLQFIMAGSGLTVLVSAFSILLAIILALLGALGRLSKNPLANGVSSFYISLIRGTPLLVQIFIWYLGLPRLGLILQPIVAGILALGVNYGAYMTEIFRAGIQAISKGQYEAAEALGMSAGQTFRRIVLPQAFRIVIPPIGNEFIAMMKDSSLVSVMSIWELTYRAQKIGRQNFRNLETFLIAAAFYWILTVIFQFLQGKLEEYMARGERR